MNLKHKYFINTQDWTLEELEYILNLARAFKNNTSQQGMNSSNIPGAHNEIAAQWHKVKSDNSLFETCMLTQKTNEAPVIKSLTGKSIALLFFNPSLRTRTSFEIAMHKLGGFASVIQPGKDAWPLETREGVIMDGEAEEHIKEAIHVISTFYDAIAVRAFPKFQNWQDDRQDPILRTITKWALKPVINMETIVHPLQELALMMTIKSHFEELLGKKFLLTWTYHPKGLNTAVANSAALISTRFGMNVTILRPQGYDLDPHFIETAKANAASYRNTVTITDNIEEAYSGADFVYAKSWGSLNHFGNWEEEKKIRQGLKHFIVDADKMKLTNNAFFSHCLPMRRNVKATDEVIDSEYSLIYEEAENRLHTTCALLSSILGERA